MQCEKIIGLTVLTDGNSEGQAELKACESIMQAKKGEAYAGHLVRESELKALIESLCENEACKNAKHVGLYWQVHTGLSETSGEFETEPPVRELATYTASLVNAGIRLRKINLAGCSTAGRESGPTSTLEKWPLKRFCDQLLVLTKGVNLDGVMVAGYVGGITLYSTSMENPGTKEFQKHPSLAKADPGRNAFHVGDKLWATRPDAANVKDVKEINSPVAQPATRRQGREMLVKHESADAAVTAYYHTWLYLTRKHALKYVAQTHQWVQIPLASYTDKDTIKTMITKAGAEAFICP